MRRLKHTLLLVATLMLGGAMVSGSGASALNYSSGAVPLTFNFDTTMTVTLSGDSLVINELSPNTKKNSNVVDVTVVTNDASGYTLSATTGNASNASTDLVAANGTFGMIGTSATTLSSGTWGYTIDGGTTFSALPLYTATPKVVNSSSVPTDSTSGKTPFQIGAYAATSQAQGNYTNVVNFVAVTNTVEVVNMQDYTLSQCAVDAVDSDVTLYDARDNKSYTVRYINGECWMTQNLRFTGTSVPAATSNVTADKTLTYYQLDTNGTSGGVCYNTTSYNHACIKDSGNATTGVWYNYYAATAGTVSGSSNSTAASQDICPKNWHLPTGPNTTADTDFNKLVGNTASGWQDSTSDLTAFGAVVGGGYRLGLLYSTGFGFWWSATADNAAGRYYLGYSDYSDGQFYGDGYNGRDNGFFVRCVRSS